jgi:hypothetical protein
MEDTNHLQAFSRNLSRALCKSQLLGGLFPLSCYFSDIGYVAVFNVSWNVLLLKITARCMLTPISWETGWIASVSERKRSDVLHSIAASGTDKIPLWLGWLA